MDEEFQARQRLKALSELDAKIVSVLGNAEEVVASIRDGKTKGVTSDSTQAFSRSIEEFNVNVEEIKSGLRSEVLKLREASHRNLLPLNLPVQAVSFSAAKEEELWDAIRDPRQSERMQD